MMTETPGARTSRTERPEPRSEFTERVPGKEWGKRFVANIERSVSNLDQGMKGETKLAAAAKSDKDVLQARFDQFNNRRDVLDDKRQKTADTIEFISDPDKWRNRIPIVKKLNEYRIRFHNRREQWLSRRLARKEGQAVEAASALKVAETRFSTHDANRLRYAQAKTERLQRGSNFINERIGRIDGFIADLETKIADHDNTVADAIAKIEKIKTARRSARGEGTIQALGTALAHFENQRRGGDAALKRLYGDLARARMHRGREEANIVMIQAGMDKVASKFNTGIVRGESGDRSVDVGGLPVRDAASGAPRPASASGLDMHALFSELFNDTKPTVAEFVEHWNEMALTADEVDIDEFLVALQEIDPRFTTPDVSASQEEWKDILTKLHTKNPAVIDGVRGSNTAEQFIDNFLVSLQLRSGTRA